MQTSSYQHTLESVKVPLSHIPPTTDRKTWAIVAMALKSEFGPSAYDVFADWSGADPNFQERNCRATWRSVKATGGITIASLIRLAKDNGYSASGQASAEPVSAESLARRAADRAAREEAEQADIAAAQAAAKLEAEAIWARHDPAGSSPYLERKGLVCPPHEYDVLFGADGTLFVGMRGLDGQLHNVQRILPAKSQGGLDKFFLPGGRVSGTCNVLGAIDGAPRVLIAEGFATALALRNSTDLPVVAAFTAGNLKSVARALRERLPKALIGVCADDDAQTEARIGRNPGRIEATEAASAVGAVVIVPSGLPEGGTDFADLAQHLGLDVVAAQVGAALNEYQAAITKKTGAQKGKSSKALKSMDGGLGVDRTQKADAPSFDRFRVDQDGLWYMPPPSKGNEDPSPKRICDALHVVGMARNENDLAACLVLEFHAKDGKFNRWMMPLTMLAGDGSAYRAALLDRSFFPPQNADHRGLLTQYLLSRQMTNFIRHTPRVGWTADGDAYVLPEQTIGAADEPTVFHADEGQEARFGQRGTVQEWQQRVSKYAVGNTRIAFAMSVAFAGPLLHWLTGQPGGGFHYVGETSTGKTTGFLAAASVWGKGAEGEARAYIQKWRNTVTALEFLAEQHNHGCLILDELGQNESNDPAIGIYMLSDGMGKGRGRSAGGLRPLPTWRCLFLSSGEITLADQIEAAGKKAKGGTEVRLIPIPTEVRPGSATETFHEFANGEKFSNYLKEQTASVYGAVGVAWLQHLVEKREDLKTQLRKEVDSMQERLTPPGAAGQFIRGVRRFALAAIAGEWATRAGLTGWPEGEAIRAAKSCMDAWIQLRGGTGSSEITSMLRHVKRWFESNWSSQFAWESRNFDTHSNNTVAAAGYKRKVRSDGTTVPTPTRSTDYIEVEPSDHLQLLVTQVRFEQDVCAGFNKKFVCQHLFDHGVLIKDPDRWTKNVRIHGMGDKPVGVYVIDLPAMLAMDV